ncbi:MAG: hypothetical protein ACFE75_02265, partial [Candidatus Hodarchaeota archaeon]
MSKIKKQDSNKISSADREWSRLRRIPRLILYGFGIITLFWYFWCVIGLVIGILYYIFLKDIAWKRNGIVLACAVGFITVFVHFYKGLAPLTLVIWFNIIFIISYGIILLISEILKRKERTLKKIIQWIGDYQKLSNKKRKAIELMVIFIPVSLWTSVSIDLGVM